MARYSVVAHDGNSYGPVDEAGLTEWTRMGRVLPLTTIRVEDTGQTVPAATLGFLASAFPAAPPPLPTFQHSAPADTSGKAVASLVLGLIGLAAWLLPIIGLPVTIIGLVMGAKGRRSRPGMAGAGIVLSIIGLVLSLINAAYGAYLGATGQLFR